MHITSSQNARVKSLLRLKSTSGRRGKEGRFLVEGVDEIRLALGAGHRPRSLISAPELAKERIDVPDVEWLTVTVQIMRRLSNRENPDGWLAVFDRPTFRLEAAQVREPALFLVLEALEKPGNLGAILRTADAVEVDNVLVCDQRADIYGPNVIRASRGTLFTVPVVQAASADAARFLREHGIRVVAANPNSGTDYQQADLSGSVAIVVGTEDSGLSDFWLREADASVRIPMHGLVNSLNVSVATALLLYEVRRQRGGEV